MKPLLIIIIPLVFFIVSGLYVEHYIYSSARTIVEEIKELQTLIDDGAWSKASDTIGVITKHWSTTRKKWNIFIDHMEVDRIDTSFTRIEKWIELEEKKDCLVELAAVKQIILHIPENERVILPNIF